MAARERQRDKRTGRATRRLSWPVLVLAGGVLLSLAANLDQAQPTAWGRITAATPAPAHLVATWAGACRPTHHIGAASCRAGAQIPVGAVQLKTKPAAPDARPATVPD